MAKKEIKRKNEKNDFMPDKNDYTKLSLCNFCRNAFIVQSSSAFIANFNHSSQTPHTSSFDFEHDSVYCKIVLMNCFCKWKECQQLLIELSSLHY